MTAKIICSVYRSPRKEGMYIYVRKQELFADVPEQLMKEFGIPGHVMDLELREDVKLARVDVREVMSSIETSGFYLQMPPRYDPFR